MLNGSGDIYVGDIPANEQQREDSNQPVQAPNRQENPAAKKQKRTPFNVIRGQLPTRSDLPISRWDPADQGVVDRPNQVIANSNKADD